MTDTFYFDGEFLLKYFFKNNAGLAIGMTVTTAAYSVGSLSGGAFNPAVGMCLPVWAGGAL